MSGRKLGGGRILGNGNGIGTPSPANAPRAASPLTPSDSTVSFHSHNSTLDSVSPPTSAALAPGFLSHDLTSNINVGGPSTSAATSSRLVCPICEEEMVTLLQLNRHIDDNHQELPEETQDEVKTWFDKQVMKAKRFQPLLLINSKLRGLEVFEANAPSPAPTPSTTVHPRPTDTVVDPEELVTRKHWQRSTGSDVCTDPTCGKRLGPLNGSINCRNCGRLFCDEHTMYQMKLSRSATHEPVRGCWCRVCETCYKSREGYNDHNGAMRDHTTVFAAIRAKKVERRNLETQRLEKRLTKLTRVLSEGPVEVATNGGSLLAPVTSLAGQKNARKLLEQSVVAWEDDQAVAKCPFCHQDFGTWTFRRHHCRTCGRVVCADAQTGCSSEVGLNVEPAARQPDALGHSEKPDITVNGQFSIDVRMCRECKDTVFSHRDFTAEVAHKPADQRAYETLRQFERGIRQLMPSFQRALLALQPHEDTRTNGTPAKNAALPRSATHAQIQEAAKFRKRLTDSFAKYDAAARRIRDLKTTSPTQLRLQAAVYSAASSFLHAHLVPLKSVPGMLKSAHSSSLSPGHRRLNGAGSASSPLRNGELVASSNSSMAGAADLETASVGGASETSTALSALETEEREMKQRLIVLEEQRFMVNDMIKNSRGARRFEEVSALSRNLEELDREIADLQRTVDGAEERWDGLYANGM